MKKHGRLRRMRNEMKQRNERPAGVVHAATRSLRLRIKRDAYPWLDKAAREVNAVWNWANATSCAEASASVCGNEPHPSAPPSQTSGRCEARISALEVAA
jgi:hypothetical protein